MFNAVWDPLIVILLSVYLYTVRDRFLVWGFIAWLRLKEQWSCMRDPLTDECLYTIGRVLVGLAPPGGLPSGHPFLLVVDLREITAWRSLRGVWFHCVVEVERTWWCGMFDAVCDPLIVLLLSACLHVYYVRDPLIVSMFTFWLYTTGDRCVVRGLTVLLRLEERYDLGRLMQLNVDCTIGVAAWCGVSLCDWVWKNMMMWEVWCSTSFMPFAERCGIS